MSLLLSRSAMALCVSYLLATPVTSVAQETITGRVIDAETGKPLVGAHLSHTGGVVKTGPRGEFSLTVVAGDSTLVTHVGYDASVIRVLKDTRGLVVRLRVKVLKVSEIVVTGGLTSQTLNQTAAAVTVLEGSDLVANGSDHLHELLPAVSNLNWAGGTSRPRYFQIRGVGERSHYAGEGPPSFSVGFVMDDVDLSGLGMVGLLHDLDQAEVFKGPQSTIFGPNAMAGLINMTSVDPTPVLSRSGSVTAGNDGLLRYGTTVNVPVNRKLAIRVGYSSGRSNGFRDNRFRGMDDTNRRNENLGRVKIRYETDTGTRVVATVFRADLDNGYDAWAPDNNEDLITYSNTAGKDRQLTHAVSLRARIPLPNEGTELVSISSYSQTELEHSYDGDWGNDEFWLQEPYGFDPAIEGWDYDFFDRNLRDRSVLTQEVRWHRDGREGRSAIVAGAYLKSMEEVDDASGWLFGGDATGLDSKFDITDVAFYGQFGRDYGDAWQLSLNARVDRNSTTYAGTYVGTTKPGAEEAVFDVAQWLAGGKFALVYRMSPHRNVYASVSRGFRAGGVNQHPYLALSNRPFDPEYLVNWELGYRFSGPRSTTALTLFYAQRSDQQVKLSSQHEPGDPNSFVYFTANAVSGRNSGLELEHSFRLSPELRLRGALGFLDSHIDGYQLEESEGKPLNLGDRASAHAPTYTTRLGADYRHRSGMVGRLELSAMDDFFFSDSHNKKSDPYQLLSGSLDYIWSSWTISLWGRNMLDERYAVRGFFFNLEPQNEKKSLYVTYGDPRQVGVTLKTNFFDSADI